MKKIILFVFSFGVLLMAQPSKKLSYTAEQVDSLLTLLVNGQIGGGASEGYDTFIGWGDLVTIPSIAFEAIDTVIIPVDGMIVDGASAYFMMYNPDWNFPDTTALLIDGHTLYQGFFSIEHMGDGYVWIGQMNSNNLVMPTCASGRIAWNYVETDYGVTYYAPWAYGGIVANENPAKSYRCSFPDTTNEHDVDGVPIPQSPFGSPMVGAYYGESDNIGYTQTNLVLLHTWLEEVNGRSCIMLEVQGTKAEGSEPVTRKTLVIQAQPIE